MGTNVKRQPKGTSSGGQFASRANAESTVSLDEGARVEPDFGKPYAESDPYVTPDGDEVFMYRKGQKVRFFDARGNQIGPEQSNVAPAVAYARSRGWRSKGTSTHTSIYPACELEPGQVVLLRDVECEVISDPIVGGAKDRFGQTLDVVRFRRLDTGEEGPMHFGPGGIVHLVDGVRGRV